MSKWPIVILIFYILSGCTAIRKGEKVIVEHERIDSISTSDLKEINLTGRNFIIQKAGVIITERGKSQKLIGIVKYKNNGTFLVSMRNPAGIEGARLLITRDSLFVNDRINKKFYYGSTVYMSKKYGISAEFLPVILGDYPDALRGTYFTCRNNIAHVIDSGENKKFVYEINCGNKKIINILITGLPGRKGLKISYRNFRRINEIDFPGIIEIKDILSQDNLLIKIEKIELTDNVEINFVPGLNYDRILLK